METIGERIKKRRKEIDMSADKLAEILNISRSTVFRYENGEIEKVPASVLMDIASALNTTSHYLMGWEEESDKNVTLFKNKDMVSGIERAIIENVQQMNGKGKKQVYEYTKVIIGNPNYIEEDSDDQILSAAHKRTDINPTKEDMDHDQKLMEDKDIWGD